MKTCRFIIVINILWILSSCATSSVVNSIEKTALISYQFSDLETLNEKESRPVVVFLHAPWCQFCRNMEETTFHDNEVADLLSSEFYFVSFDGEQKEDVAFRGRSFKYQPNGRNSGTHELAQSLGNINGTLAYPSLVILDPNYEIIFQHNAFMSPQEMKKVLYQVLSNG